MEERRARPALTTPDDDQADVEGFPVMVRLGQIQGQMSYLNQRMERFAEALERLERSVSEALAGAAPTWRSADEPFPQGVTARANPMTHPLTPMSAHTPQDNGRDEALNTVRALFLHRRRPWWQRLPDLLRG